MKTQALATAPPRTGVRSPLRANLLLLAASVALAFGVLELIARAIAPAPLPWRYPQLRYRADAATGFALAPNQHAFSADVPVTINERGLRGSVVPYERRAGRQRLLVLGDSIVFGYGVRDADVSSARLATLLDGAEVINAGTPAYNTSQEVAFLETEGRRYRPDWVVVGVCWNDLSDKADVRVSPEGWLTSGADGPPPSRFARWLESENGYAVRNALKRSRLLFLGLEGTRALLGEGHDPVEAMRADVLAGEATARTEPGWRRVAAAVDRLRALAAADGFHVMLVAFPIPLALDRPFPKSSYPARLERIGAAEGVPVVDLEPSFRAAYRGHESLFIPHDGDHPNAAGHAIAAREMATFIRRTERTP
jgi:lysophospholipase L1-like esterase